MSVGLQLRNGEDTPSGAELQYSFRAGGTTHYGTGRALDLSDRIAQFEYEIAPPAGSTVELRIPWPAKLQNICPLELVIHGRLLRSERGLATLRTISFELQTCGERAFNPKASWGSSCNVFA